MVKNLTGGRETIFLAADMDAQVVNRTRIAPTPSGFLHLGNAFSFITTSRMAKENGATIFLRIDDLDKERIRPEYVEDIFETLHFLEIAWQLGPKDVNGYKAFSQFTRLANYNEALSQLSAMNAVYACKCSRTEYVYTCACKASNIDLNEKDVCWRLKTDQQKQLILNKIDGSKEERLLPSSQMDFVVRKKDRLPSYQLASLVDDCLFNINLIVRGEDLLDSTLAQLYLADVLGKEQFKQARFVHHQLLMNNDGTKLSKSAGDTSIQYLRKHGTTRHDVLRMLNMVI